MNSLFLSKHSSTLDDEEGKWRCNRALMLCYDMNKSSEQGGWNVAMTTVRQVGDKKRRTRADNAC